MEWGTGAGSPKKRKDEATDLAVAAGGVIDQVGLVTLHKRPRINDDDEEVTARKKPEEEEEEEGDGTERVTTVLSSMQASPPLLQRPPGRPEDDAANDRGGLAGVEVVEELTTVAELAKKGGSGMLVRRPALGHRLAVFWRRDRPYVLDDACPHRGAPLSEGDIEDLVADEEDEDEDEEEEEEEEARACPARRGVEKVVPHVVCPLHYYKYDLASGRCHEGGDWSESLKVYEAWVEGDRVMAKLPRLPPISDDDSDDDDSDEQSR